MAAIHNVFAGAGGGPPDFVYDIVSNQTNVDLRTLLVNAGWDQSAKAKVTIGSGVYISSNSTGTPAMTVSGSFPGGIELTNNGFINGMGGAGGQGGPNPFVSNDNGQPGFAGGTALSVSAPITITNNGTIAGGGGGGGGGARGTDSCGLGAGGGGGGGRSSYAANSAGGAVGTTNFNGSAGGAGTFSAPGGGGSWSWTGNMGGKGGVGGSGGQWGASGSSGSGPVQSSGTSPGAGGAGGAAVTGNSNITWVATGTRNGSIS